MDYFNSLMVGVSLLTVSVAVLTLLIGLFYFAFRFSGRVSDLEKGQEAFESRIAQFTQEVLKGHPRAIDGGDLGKSQG